MTPTYRIKNWDEHFEVSQSRKCKTMTWVAVPNRQDGKGYRRVANHPRSVELFCAWNLIIQIASRQKKRGVLEDGDGGLTPEDLADSTGYPKEIFGLAFSVLTEPRVGWLEKVGGDNNAAK